LRETLPDTIELTPSTDTERAKVESWRLHVLIEAGYPLPLAERLAGSAADLHLAVDLVAAGCAADVAAEILL
jgi:uncharacterized protein YhjY with autotransporter beta-barrel domain